MSAIVIAGQDKLNGVALRLATAGWMELYDKGLSDGTINSHFSYKALVAHVENGREMIAVGVMTFDVLEHDNSIFIYQSYVLPEHRGQGVYRAMWESLVVRAASEGRSKIASGTHTRNQPMRTIAAKLGRVEESVFLTFDLAPYRAQK